jgi:short-subunit dehydrogenase
MADLGYQRALIVGAGPGVSASLARLFAKNGLKVTLASRTTGDLDPLLTEIGGRAFACDASKPEAVAKLFADMEADGGAPDVVVYNASYRTRGPVVELVPAEVEKSLIVSAFAGSLRQRS